MEEKDLPSFDELGEDDSSSGIIDRGLIPTESIDLQGLISELDSTFRAPEPEEVQKSSFGKLMEALPIAALLIDRNRKIIFANLSWERICPDYQNIVGREFSVLFPEPRAAAMATQHVEKVFSSRKTQVLEGLVSVEGEKIWARAHLRSLRFGEDPSILVLIEDLTLERTQLRLQSKLRKELQKRVEDRTKDLQRTNEQLQQEIGQKQKAEEALRKHRQLLENQVAERTSELLTTIKRLKQEAKDRKKAEESLNSSQRRFNVAFHAYPDAVSISRLQDSRYIEVNESFCRASGYTREEVIGHTESEIKHWARSEHRDHMVNALEETGSVREYEAVFRKKDGKMMVASLSAEIIEIDGESYLLTIATDITDAKRAERERIRMATAFEHAAESMVITDVKGVIKYVNPAVERMTGYPSEEIVGENIRVLRSPDNEPQVFNEAKLSLKEGKPWKGRMINKRKDGSRYEVESTISPVKGQSGRVINFVVVERDVTDEAKQEKRLRRTAKMEALSSLASGIARDFNDALMVIIGYSHMIKDALPEDSVAARDINMALEAGRRARNLVEDLLAFTGEKEPDRRPVDVEHLLQEALDGLTTGMPTNTEIRQEIDTDAGFVLGNPGQIRQVITHLCANAFDAMEQGNGVLSLALQPEHIGDGAPELADADMAPGQYVTFTVSDTGEGMTTSVVERVFEPYFTTKATRRGTGGGLAVVHGIVKAHRGGIFVDSEPGRGSTFKVYLPRCETVVDKERPKTVEPVIRARVLLVDDDDLVAGIGERTLSAAGHKVTVITSSDDALMTFRSSPDQFDVVVTDLHMPGMSGLDLAKEIMIVRPDVPVILCGGSTDAPSGEVSKETGVKRFLVKPVVPHDLERTVAEVLA